MTALRGVPALRLALTALLVALASGCATVPGAAAPPKEDPWENFNRKVFSFNEAVDEAVLSPWPLRTSRWCRNSCARA